MSAPLDPERSEVERTLWHTLDEAGWADREIQEHFAEYCDRIAHELAEEIRESIRAAHAAKILEPWLDGTASDAADLIDPEAE